MKYNIIYWGYTLDVGSKYWRVTATSVWRLDVFSETRPGPILATAARFRQTFDSLCCPSTNCVT